MALQSCFEQTLRPAGREFSNVPAEWPGEPELCVQYLVLCRRVHRAFKAAQASTSQTFVPHTVVEAARSWGRVHGYSVLEVWTSGCVQASLHRFFLRSGWSSALAARVASRISAFADSEAALPESSRAPARTPQRDLRHVHGAHLEGGRGKVVGAVSPGAVLSLKGRLVEVCHTLRFIDVASVAAALDQHPWFAVGARAEASAESSPGQAAHARSAWAAARVHHRCRLLIAPDACCEAVGSLVRSQWNPKRGLTPTQVADSVFLQQAGVSCVGSPRDEALVEAVVRQWEQTSKYKVRAPGERRVPPAVRAQHIVVEASGRTLTPTAVPTPTVLLGITTATDRRKALRDRGKLRVTLPQTMRAALPKARAHTGELKRLPVSVEHLHAQQRGVAGSVERQVKKTSLKETKWAKERDTLTGADDGGTAIGAGSASSSKTGGASASAAKRPRTASSSKQP